VGTTRQPAFEVAMCARAEARAVALDGADGAPSAWTGWVVRPAARAVEHGGRRVVQLVLQRGRGAPRAILAASRVRARGSASDDDAVHRLSLVDKRSADASGALAHWALVSLASPGSASGGAVDGGGAKVSVLLFTVTLYANLAHSLTRSP
jgi:hypothetical protein